MDSLDIPRILNVRPNNDDRTPERDDRLAKIGIDSEGTHDKRVYQQPGCAIEVNAGTTKARFSEAARMIPYSDGSPARRFPVVN